MNPIGIIADDLTGAADTGAQFSRRGARVLVCVDCDDMPFPLHDAWDVVVVNTHSRNLPPKEARREVVRAHNWLAHAGWPTAYKKIDSTLRGNVAAEMEEMLALGAERLALAPAFPLNGRTVEGGILLVNGVPVDQTDVAKDPLAPVRTAKLRELFGKAFDPVESVPLEVMHGNSNAAEDYIRDRWKKGVRLLIADASTQDDLSLLARSVTTPGGETVVVGSAGAARELAQRLCSGAHSNAPPPTVRTGPVLIIAGSRQEVTQRQLAVLQKRGKCHIIEVDPTGIKDPWSEAIESKLVADIEGAARLASRGGLRALVISIAPAPAKKETPAEYQLRSERLNRVLGRVAARLHKPLDSPGIVMTGGDVAMAVLTALGTRSLQLGGELLPGIPLAWAAEGPLKGLRLVTKAGGYGPPEALAQAALALAM